MERQLNDKERKVVNALGKAGPDGASLAALARQCFPGVTKQQANSWVRNSLRRPKELGLLRALAPGVYAAVGEMEPLPLAETSNRIENPAPVDQKKDPPLASPSRGRQPAGRKRGGRATAAKKKAKKAKRRATASHGASSEVLSITSGFLGPLGKCDVEIKPLTLLVGRQGTGKSLLAQMLYFFRGLPQLVQLDVASRRLKDTESAPEKIVRRIIDGMRSSHRSFARLTVPSVALRWRGNLAATGVHAKHRDLRLNIQSKTSQVVPAKPLVDLVEQLRDERSAPPFTCVFVPTERLLYAMQLGPSSLRVMGAPLLLETFAQMMEIAGRLQSGWDEGEPDTHQGRWVRKHLLEPLAGEARLRGNAWRWSFDDAEGTRRQIDFDMASSGQRANWPLSVIPQVLFTLRARGELAQEFTLYVEEPEIHLHPSAERAVVEVLAYLVNQGVRVVLTTHSLTVLYTINNLLTASRLAPSELAEEIDPAIRLRLDDVAAYHLRADGSIDSVVGDEGTIDERALAEVADDLSMQLSRIVKKAGPR